MTIDGVAINFASATATTPTLNTAGRPRRRSLSASPTRSETFSRLSTWPPATLRIRAPSAAGEVTLNSGTAVNATTLLANGLDVTADSGGVFKTLGFTTTTSGLPAATPTGGGQAGTGFVIGSDVTTFDNESISGGAITVYNASGTPVNVQLRWAMTDTRRHLESVLSERRERHRFADRLDQRRSELHLQLQRQSGQSLGRRHHHPGPHRGRSSRR